MTEASIHDLTGLGRSFEVEPKLLSEAKRSFERLVAAFPEGMAAYVLLGLNDKGEWTMAWRTAADSPIGPTMLAGLAKEAVNVEITVDRRIRDMVERI